MKRRNIFKYAGMTWILAVVAIPALAGPPVPATPEQIQEMVSAAGDSEAYGGADVVYVLDEADVYVQPSGLANTESCQVLKLLTAKGVKRESVQRFDFDPATRRVTIKSARIHRKDGTVEDVALGSTVTQPTVQRWIYWGGNQHLLTLPNLEVGDSIELRVSKIGFNIAYLDESAGSGTGTAAGHEEKLQPPMPGHWYEVTLFQSTDPIVKKRYSVHMPSDKPVQYEVYNGALKSSLWFGDDTHIYTWTAEDVPAVKQEPHMVALDDCVTKLVMATVPDWEMKSRWFYDVNETQFDADKAIRDKVAEITKGLKTLDEKIAACNHWVADNIRYYGTSRGPCEGFTLHRGIETFHDRGGVCKDKAGMLVTMLRVLGVEAYAALTMAGSRVEEIPADQFNHTVTVIKDESGEFRILDPTWIPLSREMWSSREALQGLVYGTAEGESLTLSPYYPPEYNGLHCNAKSTLDASGTLSTRIEMDMKGYPCTYLRRNVDRYPAPERRAAFEEVLNISPNAQLTDYEYTDPYDYSRDSYTRLEVAADRYAAGNGEVRTFHMPLMSHPLAKWLAPDLAYPVDKDERQYGMRIRATRLLDYTETIALPAGWKIEKLPESRKLDSPAASLNFEATANGNEVTYTFELALKKQIIPPDEYPQYKETIDTMNKIAQEWIVCSATEDVAPASGQAARAISQEVTHE